jgi:hypothetical protein
MNGGAIRRGGEIFRLLVFLVMHDVDGRGRIPRLSFSVMCGIERLTVMALSRIAAPEISLFEDVPRLRCCDIGVDMKFGSSKVRSSVSRVPNDGLHEVDTLLAVALSSENDDNLLSGCENNETLLSQG